MGWIRRRRKGATTRHDALKATATRALTPQVKGMMPTLLLTFELDGGERLEVELQYQEASKFVQQALASYSAIAEPIRPISPFIN